ncbi:NADP-dependent oxidoreductase domain-containing protein [Aspergillus venezuelensis]
MAIEAALDRAAQHRTTIIIAHRLSTIKHADRIAVLRKGKVIESGDHQGLVSKEGRIYAGLVHAQTLSLEGSMTDFATLCDAEDDNKTNGEESRTAITKCEEDSERGVKTTKQSRGLFGSFLLLFLESRSYWRVMILGFVVSAAAGTTQPLYAWMFSRSIYLFKWQNNHPKLMDEMDFMGIMWTVFAASAGIACLLHHLSLLRLRGVIHSSQLSDRVPPFDMFEFGRRDPNVPLEITFGVIEREYIQTGKIGGIALSEVRAETIHEAVKYTRVVAVEAELSMFTPDILTNGVAAACAQYDIPIIAYSPIGRGMLAGQLKKDSDLPADSLLRQMDFPRFQEENFEKNLQLVSEVEEIAARKGCTPAQLAINWMIALLRRVGTTIVPIPESSTPERVKENSMLVDVSDEELDQIEEILKRVLRRLVGGILLSFKLILDTENMSIR